MESSFRIAVIALLIVIAALIRYEGERITKSMWYPSEPIQVTVTNRDDDAVPVAIMRSQEGDTSTPQTPVRNSNGLTPDEKARFDRLYPRSAANPRMQ